MLFYSDWWTGSLDALYSSLPLILYRRLSLRTKITIIYPKDERNLCHERRALLNHISSYLLCFYGRNKNSFQMLSITTIIYVFVSIKHICNRPRTDRVLWKMSYIVSIHGITNILWKNVAWLIWNGIHTVGTITILGLTSAPQLFYQNNWSVETKTNLSFCGDIDWSVPIRSDFINDDSI